MKKLLLALFALSLPIHVMAQDKPQEFSEKMLYQKASDLFPIVCKGNLTEAIKFIQQCYKNSSNNEKSIEKCLIVDRYIISIAKGYNELIKENKRPVKSYTEDNITYINDHSNRLISYFLIIKKDRPYNFDAFNEFIVDSTKKFSALIQNFYLMKSIQDHLNENVCTKNEFIRYSLYDEL